MKISDQSFLITDVPSLSDLRKKVIPYREQEKVHNRWLKERLDTIMPKVLKESGLDMWVVAFNEYNEDPLYKTLLPKHLFTARRTMCLVFVLKGVKPFPHQKPREQHCRQRRIAAHQP